MFLQRMVKTTGTEKLFAVKTVYRVITPANSTAHAYKIARNAMAENPSMFIGGIEPWEGDEKKKRSLLSRLFFGYGH